jgi:hypothetical protein
MLASSWVKIHQGGFRERWAVQDKGSDIQFGTLPTAITLAVVTVVDIPTIPLPIKTAKPNDRVNQLPARGGKPNDHPDCSERSAAADELRCEQSTEYKDRCTHDEACPRIVSIQQPTTAHDEDCHTSKPNAGADPRRTRN